MAKIVMDINLEMSDETMTQITETLSKIFEIPVAEIEAGKLPKIARFVLKFEKFGGHVKIYSRVKSKDTEKNA